VEVDEELKDEINYCVAEENTLELI